MTTLLDEPRKIEKSTNARVARTVVEAKDDAAPVAAAAPMTAAGSLKPAPRWQRLPIKRMLGAAALAGALIVGSTYGYSYWKWSGSHESTDNAFIDGPI